MKRSQWDQVVKRAKRVRKNPGWRQPIAVACGEDYSYNLEPPASPPTAYYWRRRPSLYDALREMKADTPAPTKTENPRAWEMVTPHREAVGAVLDGLCDPSGAVKRLSRRPEVLKIYGGDERRALASMGKTRTNYGGAERALFDWCEGVTRSVGLKQDEPLQPDHPDPRVRVAWEMRFWAHSLLFAYADPPRFFREFAPQIDSNRLFDRDTLITNGRVDWQRLGQSLHTWGFGALLNPLVREAFDSADAETLVRAISYAEGREFYDEGSPPGSQKGKPKPGRPRNSAASLRAGSLEKRIQREGLRKRSK